MFIFISKYLYIYLLSLYLYLCFFMHFILISLRVLSIKNDFAINAVLSTYSLDFLIHGFPCSSLLLTPHMNWSTAQQLDR